MRVRHRLAAQTAIQQANWTQGLKDAKLCGEIKDKRQALRSLVQCYWLRKESMNLDVLGLGFQVDMRDAMVEEFFRVRELSS